MNCTSAQIMYCHAHIVFGTAGCGTAPPAQRVMKSITPRPVKTDAQHQAATHGIGKPDPTVAARAGPTSAKTSTIAPAANAQRLRTDSRAAQTATREQKSDNYLGPRNCRR